jgi:ABC-2 type transport system ATP-binding protein
MIIETRDLRKHYGRHAALGGLNMAVPEGAAYALIGANGAGKTSTIRILMNIIAPSGGHAAILGADTRKLSPAQLRQIGYVSENQELPGHMSLGQYLDYLRPFYPQWDRALEAEVLKQLHLPLDRPFRHLSHGMRVKAALACALPYRPKLLILDEPFSGLDPLARDEFIASVLARAGDTTVLISSQELSEIESFATDIGFLEEGRLLFQESLEALQARLKSVRIILDREARAPAACPASWLDIRCGGNGLSFVETRYGESELNARIAALFTGVQQVEIEPVPLRSMFVSLARAARGKEAA